MKWSFASTVLQMVLSVVAVYGWDTSYDDPFLYACSSNQFLSYFRSSHSNRREDRVWDFECRGLPNAAPTDQCYWTDYVNSFDDPMAFLCPNDKVVTGVSSYHQNQQEDRRFKFRCCRPRGHVVHGCEITSFANGFDADMIYTVPTGRVLAGMISYHDNRREDRRFKFIVCSLQPIQTSSNIQIA